MGWGGNGYAKPGKGTIKYLATLTHEEVLKCEAKIKAKNATKAAANEKETKVEKDKQKELAQQVHDAIYGLGTNEEAVYQALMQLNKNEAKIKEFRELYASTFKADLVNDIEWDFSGKEEAKALGLLNISDGKEKEEKGVIEPDTKKEEEELEIEKVIGNSYGKDQIYKAAEKVAKEMRAERKDKNSYDAQCIDGLRRLLFEVTGSRELYGKGEESYNIFHHPEGELPTWKTSANDAIDHGITKSGNWKKVDDLAAAMKFANEGKFVISTFYNEQKGKSGHVNVILGGTANMGEFMWNNEKQTVPRVFDTGIGKRWPDKSIPNSDQKMTNAYGKTKHPKVKFYVYRPLKK